ncbi:MAG: hypothetical protein IPK82_05325 [Polyangiaceae bacterium]|nr:hypothetical protein [Polyangiaceae bacterium]
MTDDKDVTHVVDELLAQRKQFSRDDLMELVRAVKAAGGMVESASWEPGDPICPEIRLPFPPRGGGWDALLTAALKHGKVIEVFPKGIPKPDFAHVIIRNR